MGQMWIVVYLLVACAHLSQQRSDPNSSTYLAAVVEYPPKYLTNSSETLRVNSDAYVRLINTAGRVVKADIIVFPEDGLTTVHLPEREEMEGWTTVIPSPSDNYIPCSGDTIQVSDTLRKISCAARDYEIYVVINIAEKAPCANVSCPRDKMFYYYNSNVVFDRTGKIIARYRKTNLFNEPFDVTAVPEIVTFDTDFGVKFGTFICFDILFREPPIILTRDHQVTDIVYTTAWFSEAPFLTAVQTQAGWSFAENVNLLASGYNRPDFGNAGSGIYLGRKGVGKAIMPAATHEELLIYEVRKIKDRTNIEPYHDDSKNEKAWPCYQGTKRIGDDLCVRSEVDTKSDDKLFLKHDNIEVFQTLSLKGNATETVCQNNFCCEFKVEITKLDSRTKYRLVVFNGIRHYSNVKARVRACGIIQCSNDSVSSCGSVNTSEVVFNNIEIAATFHDYKNNLIMPSTLSPDLLPLKQWTFNEHVHDDHVHVNMYLNNSINNVVTFGIYSRDFSNDANRISFYTATYFIVLFVTLFSRL
ncbi:PREDICTED: vanin-like protein 1 isoform X2 [Vollenhovia emeryi]|nr:PREDICTED: vanin-like protein 1 isoform X2 [Vollenhovia emeryi]XP_011865174.1 PREDICTED: vanin-like protein 1 isoform X2 [Vollenhovia emeryi]